VTHGWSFQVVPGTFEYPLSERSPKGFKDADPDSETMSLQVDDIYRMFEMTILICILTPLSVEWLSTRRHVGMPLHRLIMVLYFVDIVRRHSHPHSWVLNTPIFVIWLLDKLWSNSWRRCVSPRVHRVKLGEDYMVLYWKQPTRRRKGAALQSRNPFVGPNFFLRLNDSSWLEGAHVFTTFENRLKVPIKKGKYFCWSVGTVIRVFRKKRMPRLGSKDSYSHTMRMYDAKRLDITAWGPSQGEMSAHLYHALRNATAPVVLVCAGSGIGYAIDALQWATKHAIISTRGTKNNNHSLKVLFTTRSLPLFEWVKDMVAKIASHDQGFDETEKRSLCVVLALTSVSKDESSKVVDEEAGTEDNGIFSTNYGRFVFDREIERGSIVFCQGSQGLKSTVSKACRHKKARFFGGL
jgi:hypothetical protein